MNIRSVSTGPRWLACAAFIIIALALSLFRWQTTNGVYIRGDTSTLSHPFLIDIPGISPTTYVPESYRFTGARSIPVAVPLDERQFTVASIQAEGFVLDRRDPKRLERILIERAKTSRDLGASISNELTGIIQDAARDELKDWPPEFLDSSGGTLALERNIVENRIMDDPRLGRLGLRCSGATLHVTRLYGRFDN